MKSILAACVIALLTTGCIYPDFHTTERLHPIQGHVVDSSTGKPLAHAKVAIHDHSYFYTTTDESGYFHFSKVRNYHWGYCAFIVLQDIPKPEYWSESLDISHSGFIPRQIDASSYDIQLIQTNTAADYMVERWQGPPAGPYVLKNIALTPSNRPPSTATP